MNVGCRQIHLDFHNSEHVGEIGADFDPGEFAECLARAAVDHVNLFAKCHHSWSYYPTTIGRVHPGLSFDLFGRQVESVRTTRSDGLRVIWSDTLNGLLFEMTVRRWP